MKPLIERVKALSIEVGDCWEWHGSTQSTSTTPIIRYKRTVMSVMRALALEAGMKVDGYVATAKCRNPKCVTPDHLELVTRKRLNTRVSNEQQYQKRLNYRANMSIASKKRKLTDSQVLEIRDSDTDRNILAQEYGISRTHVNAIKSGYSRARLTTNIFAGLMR